MISKRYQRSNIKENSQRYQQLRCYNVSKTSVSFRYQLKRLYDVSSWSVWRRHQLVHHYDVSNWSVLQMYQWDVAKTSQIIPSYWRTSWDVGMMSQHRAARSNLSVTWVNFLWVLGSTLFWHLWWFSLIKVPASTSLQRLKDVGFI